MKDQRLLLKKCHNNNVPALFFQGTDCCAIEILKSAEDIYKKNGCSMEFLYDFGCVRRNFEGYHDDYPSTFSLPKLEDARNVKVLIGCINEDIPVIVFQGTDRCAVEILRSAEDIYIQNEYNSVYLSGFESFINEFEEYSKQNANAVKLPGLSVIEEEFVREDMDYDFESAVDRGDVAHIEQMEKLGYQPSDEIMISAMKKDSCVIGYFDNLSEEVQLAAVQNSAYAVQGISTPTNKVLITAIRKCPDVFELIDKPSEIVKIAAVKLKPGNLRFISEPSKDVIIAAILADPSAVKLCDNIPEATYKDVVEPYLIFKSAVENNDFSKLAELNEQGYQPPLEVVKSLSDSFSESILVAVQKIFGLEQMAQGNMKLAQSESNGTDMMRHVATSIEQSL